MRTFAESVQKALRSLETGLTGFNEQQIPGASVAGGKDAVRAALADPTPERLLNVAQAFRHGLTVAEVHAGERRRAGGGVGEQGLGDPRGL